jgi:hypothetical protein
MTMTMVMMTTTTKDDDATGMRTTMARMTTAPTE